MAAYLTDVLKRDRLAQALLLLFILLSVWWAFVPVGAPGENYQSLLWAASYQIVAFLGGLWGLSISRSWGGMGSVMGRSIISFSLGLLFQTFGQSTFSFYNLVLQVEVPYPSMADIGFFGSIPFYIYGIILLARAAGVAMSMRSFLNQIQVIIIPLAMLGLSYFFFLRGYEFDWSNPLRVILDFGYPLGQAIYISIAILTYTLSKSFLGGLMKPKILFILIALIVQYLADYNFLYQALNETWQNGGYGDYIYLVAYLFMALGLLQLKMPYILSEKMLK
jgi:hypothetical protein